MADTTTTNLNLRKRASGDAGDWSGIHNDSMDRLETRLTRNGTADPNVGETGDFIGQLYIRTGAGNQFPDIWICTAAGAPGTWRSIFESTRLFTKSVGGASWTNVDSVAGTISLDLSANNYFEATLDENATVANPTNIPAAGSFILQITQDAATARTLSWGNTYKWAFGTEITMPTTLSAVHLFQIIIDQSGAPVVAPLFSIAVP